MAKSKRVYALSIICAKGDGLSDKKVVRFKFDSLTCREGWTDHNPVSNAFGKMWIILEPILFALIGSEVQVNPRQI